MEALIRADAAEKVRAEFEHRPLDWKKGDCVRLGAAAIQALGNPKPKALKGRLWSSEAGALLAWRRAGFTTFTQALEASGLERVSPAKRWPCDLVVIPGAGQWSESITVAMNGGDLLGFLQGRCALITSSQYVSAWRAPWQKRSR